VSCWQDGAGGSFFRPVLQQQAGHVLGDVLASRWCPDEQFDPGEDAAVPFGGDLRSAR
jgi:hypothetical protein